MKDIRKALFLLIFLLATTVFPCYATEADYGGLVRVGILDSGIDQSKIPVVCGYNFLENSDDVTDNKGHGTKVAEIVLSVAPKAELIALKCTELNQNNDNSAIIKAIYEAVDQYKCDVLNISIGMPDDAELQKAIDYVTAKGCIVVSAVGNDGEISYKQGKIYYPAGYENVVGVGAVDEQNVVCQYSQKNNSVYITTQSLEGTSFAAAKITGAAAVAKQFDGRITQALFMKILKDSATDCGTDGYDTSYGHGVFDIEGFTQDLTNRYLLLVTKIEDGIATLCNLSEEDVLAKVVYLKDTVESEEILLKPKEIKEIDINKTKKCFIWQKSIYDIVWIKKGEL